MKDNNTKPWYRSKAKVGSVLIAIGAIGSFIVGKIDANAAFLAISAALTAFGFRDAMK